MGRSIITPVNQRLVHRLADELPVTPEPLAQRCPHLHNQGSARERRRPRSARFSVPRAQHAVPLAALSKYRLRRADAHTMARLPRATQTTYTTCESRICPRGAVASTTIPPRGTGQAAARRAAAELKALHPPLRHFHIRTSTGKHSQPAYPRLQPPLPVPRAATAADAQVQARSR